jgi:hypothetical protein
MEYGQNKETSILRLEAHTATGFNGVERRVEENEN